MRGSQGTRRPDGCRLVGRPTDQRLGVGPCILQADGEHEQRAFVEDVIDEVSRICTIGVAAAHSPAHDHQAQRWSAGGGP